MYASIVTSEIDIKNVEKFNLLVTISYTELHHRQPRQHSVCLIPYVTGMETTDSNK